MLTTKKREVPLGLILLFVLIAWFQAGCTPPGPRALLKGAELIEEGQHAKAVERLIFATNALPHLGEAYNYLGLAYHHAGHHGEAANAYEEALRRDGRLASAHYNLGRLHLEQGELERAIFHLSSYTVLEPESHLGWLYLGVAQLRAGQLSDAERSLDRTLQLEPQLSAALNALGILEMQRNNPERAWAYFHSALAADEKYAPAMLNIAIVADNSLNNPELALEKYQRFLELGADPGVAVQVRAVMEELQFEIAKAEQEAVRDSVVLAQENLDRDTANDGPMEGSARVSGTNIVAGDAKRSQVPAEEPAKQKGAESRSSELAVKDFKEPPTSVKQEVTNVVDRAQASQDKDQEPVRVAKAPVDPVLPVQEVVLEERPPIRAEPEDEADSEPEFGVNELVEERAQARSLPPPRRFTPPPALEQADARKVEVRESEESGILDRMNPMRWFGGSRDGTPERTGTSDGEEQGIAAVNGTGAGARQPLTLGQRRPAVKRVDRAAVPRYEYRVKEVPPAGNRERARGHVVRGIEAHGRRDLKRAIAAYQEALRHDPGYFEALYNLGIAAYELKEYSLALWAYEGALAVDPSSRDARYNFALALQRAGYFVDAAMELERLLAAHPMDVRGHFALANLYAQELGEVEKAEPHYRRVLALDPGHAQSVAIRQWLGSRP